MAERDDNSSWILRNAGTLIAATAVAASIIAQWAIIDDRIKRIEDLEDDLTSITSRMDRLEVRYEYLWDIIKELRPPPRPTTIDNIDKKLP